MDEQLNRHNETGLGNDEKANDAAHETPDGGGEPGEAERHLSQCPVCLEVYADPKVLPCDHSFCASCVQQLKQGSESGIQCPLCKVDHDVSGIRSDFRLQQFLDALTEKQKKEGGGTNKKREGYFTFQSYSKFVALPLVQFYRQYTTIWSLYV